eukprot:gene3660-6475_t
MKGENKNKTKEEEIKFVLVAGGVLSGIGKGVIASSTGVILQSMGCNVTSIKIDPYLNVDAGTMSPFEHGEVFVLDDGGETDLDLGNYERFLGITLTHDCNITTGKIYKQVISKERRGDYLGKTVQVVPHITDAIQDWIVGVAVRNLHKDQNDKRPKVCVIELGGTVGDIESMPFVEAMRQFQFRVGKDNFFLTLVSLIPILGNDGEQKTKPSQHAAKELRSLGLSADVIACRSQKPISESTREKLSKFCHVDSSSVIGVHDVSNLFEVPLLLIENGLHTCLANKFKLDNAIKPKLDNWSKLVSSMNEIKAQKEGIVKIVLVGKYTGLSDSYHSVSKSLLHGSILAERKVDVEFLNSDHLVKENVEQKEFDEAWKTLKEAHGILVPGGFSVRGIEGKILAVEYARKNKIPFLGICLGMQVAIIEFARNVLGYKDANSLEFDPDTKTPVIIPMPEISREQLGGTMRLGLRKSYFKKDCIIKSLYSNLDVIEERHRHRYEANYKMIDEFEEKGMSFVAQDETGQRQEIIELDDHPYFVGCQYHPEYLSRWFKPSPPFVGLVLAASGKLDSFLKENEKKRKFENDEIEKDSKKIKI